MTKFNVLPHDQTADFTLDPITPLPSGGYTFIGRIRGDEVLGANPIGDPCTQRACRFVYLDDYKGLSKQIEVTLRWTNPSNQLTLYVPNSLVYWPGSYDGNMSRYCCSSPLSATYELNACLDFFVVAFEQAAGRLPGPADVQEFEFSVRPSP